MRKESEKKVKVTSVRMTEEQHRIVQEKAAANGDTVSSYLANLAVNGDKLLTPKTMVEAQGKANELIGTVKELSPEKAEEFERTVNELWSVLL